MKTLVLDFGGVISKSVFETLPEAEDALGLPRGSLTWRGPFDPDSDALWRDMIDDKISERDYYHHRVVETGKLAGRDFSGVDDFIRATRGDNPMAVIRPEALDAIGQVKSAGYGLALLSNELDLFYGSDFREKLPFLADFDPIIDATYTGILKPDPRAYGFITEARGIPPASCVFVDDQMRNIKGAAGFGMQTVHFDVTNPAAGYGRALELLGIA